MMGLVTGVKSTSRRESSFQLPFAGAYRPIAGYGAIGNMRTVALVSFDGSIDWCCFPRFDSSSVFAALLDRVKGGSWRMSVDGNGEARQLYLSDTNVLQTSYKLESGEFILTDFMPCSRGEVWSAPPEIHRIVKCVSGSGRISLHLEPRFNYGRERAQIGEVEGGFLLRAPREELVFSASCGGLKHEAGVVSGAVDMSQGQEETFVLSYGESRPRLVYEYQSKKLLDQTVRYWRDWVSTLRYTGRWREQVVRSALILRLLVYSATGAMVAAPTTSLPEVIGGGRNWDYRYSWIRDSAISLWAFYILGSSSEAERYLHWLIDNNPALDLDLRLMYRVDGGKNLAERELSHLEGYMKSKPVRVGNAAAKQLQLDAHGCILDALYFSSTYGAGVSDEMYYRFVRPLAHFICDNWRRRGNGIWEFRNGRGHFVYTKAWCYAGLDRACKIARATAHDSDTERWRSVMDEIKEEILREGWNDVKRTFVMRYGASELDASVLMLPLIGFIRSRDWRMKATVDAVMNELSEGGLVRRYSAGDGFDGKEGCFFICNFWLVACLARQGRVQEAGQLFERLLSLSNHLGLFSEEVDPNSGELLGNFPQAFSHMGLILAAYELERSKIGSRRKNRKDGEHGQV
jgi:GH15 family glucan-1,4-alpha-glucosidase